MGAVRGVMTFRKTPFPLKERGSGGEVNGQADCFVEFTLSVSEGLAMTQRWDIKESSGFPPARE